VGDRLGGPMPDPLGGVPVGALAEGLLEAGMDRPEVDPQAGQQLVVGGLRPGQDPLGDQPVDPGPDGVEVEAVGHQHPGGQVVVLGEQAGRCSGPRYWWPSRRACSRASPEAVAAGRVTFTARGIGSMSITITCDPR
jgi:hypothetical protein